MMMMKLQKVQVVLLFSVFIICSLENFGFDYSRNTKKEKLYLLLTFDPPKLS